MFQCPQLYIDMDYELKEYERKQEERIKESDKIKKITIAEPKKNVFAKFKSYNKEAGKVNKGAPPKNSIPNTKLERNPNDKLILKESANRYLYQGKLNNFCVLKKVERTDKKHKMTFADFKQMDSLKK